MEESTPQSGAESTRSEDIAQAIAAKRKRMREFSRRQLERLGTVESQLSATLEQIADELARDRRALTNNQQQYTERTAQVQRQVDEVRDTEARLQEQQAALDRAREELAEKQNRVSEQHRRMAAELEEQRAAHSQEINARRNELSQLESHDDSRQQEVLNATLLERDSLAEQVARQQTELRGLQAQLEEIRGQYNFAQSQLLNSEQRAAEVDQQLQALRQEKSRIQNEFENQNLQGNAGNVEFSALQSQLAAIEAERSSMQQLLDSANREISQQSEMAERIDKLQSERDALTQLLAEAEQQLTSGSHSGGATEGSSNELEDLRRRYEMSLEDLRELKTKNADLDKRLAAARAAKGMVPSESHSGGMDWESQKRRMLAQLESEHDEGDEEQKTARLEIESVIDITDAVAAEKDREIQELKQLLDQQSSNLGAVAVGAAAFGEMLDKDEVIRQERERLQLLQVEWEGKLRQAEIDLSVQRAKLARERNELEEKQRHIDQQKTDQVNSDAEDTAAGKTKKPTRGRWLSRLGLKEE
jgi:chromosome segregation ATPase